MLINKDTIVIAMCSDEVGADFMMVAIKSIFINNANENIEIHILTDHFDDQTIDNLNLIADYFGQKIAIHIIDKTPFIGLPGVGPGYDFPIAAMYRLILPDTLKEYKKVIYLDTDIIVEGSLRGLWNTDLTGYAMAGVNDLAEFTSRFNHDYYRNILGFNEGEYVNSGVLLIDLDYFRKHDVGNLCFAWLNNNRDKAQLPDQSALNVVLRGKIILLPEKYNAMINLYLPIIDSKKVVHTPTADEARRSPIIIHFSAYKPWISYGIPAFPPNRHYFNKYRNVMPPMRLRKRRPYDGNLLRRRFYYLLFKCGIVRRLPAMWNDIYGLDPIIV